jgi:hypothetical protein
LYKIFNIASPYLFPKKPSAAVANNGQAGSNAKDKDGLSKRQQKMQARYEKGDKRVQTAQR